MRNFFKILFSPFKLPDVRFGGKHIIRFEYRDDTLDNFFDAAWYLYKRERRTTKKSKKESLLYVIGIYRATYIGEEGTHYFYPELLKKKWLEDEEICDAIYGCCKD